jgi:hypothetical protein
MTFAASSSSQIALDLNARSQYDFACGFGELVRSLEIRKDPASFLDLIPLIYQRNLVHKHSWMEVSVRRLQEAPERAHFKASIRSLTLNCVSPQQSLKAG